MGDGPLVNAAAADDGRIDVTRAASMAALGIFLLVTISGRGQDLLPSPARMALVLAWPAALLLFALSNRVSVVIGYCIAGGFVLRWVDFFPGGGSDVLPATAEAIATTLAGGNPYAHWYMSERPPSDNFPYPPIEMLIHLPGYLVAGLTGVRFTEVIAALLVMLAFAWLARRVSVTAALPALALYAALPNLVNLSVDAGNDTSTGAMLLLAVLAAAWAAEREFDQNALLAAGLVAGLAAGTKQTTLFAVILLAAFVWHRAGRPAATRYIAAAVLLLGLSALPFLVLDPGRFVLMTAGQLGAHDSVYGWNFWVFAQWMGWAILDVRSAAILVLAATGLATMVMLAFYQERLASAALAGVVVTLVALLAARWTAYSYFAVVVPVILALPILVRWDALHPPPVRAAPSSGTATLST
jgi:Dolichyl-phosphate-mannose-protein mannosyltransferase